MYNSHRLRDIPGAPMRNNASNRWRVLLNTSSCRVCKVRARGRRRRAIALRGGGCPAMAWRRPSSGRGFGLFGRKGRAESGMEGSPCQGLHLGVVSGHVGRRYGSAMPKPVHNPIWRAHRVVNLLAPPTWGHRLDTGVGIRFAGLLCKPCCRTFGSSRGSLGAQGCAS